MEEVFFLSRFLVALLAVLATGAMIALWHLRLESSGIAAKLAALALYFLTLAVLIRTLAAMARQP